MARDMTQAEIYQAQLDNLVYWAGRVASTQDALTEKTAIEARRQLARYYESAQRRVIVDFVTLYEKIQAKKANGAELLVSDLYSEEGYWKLQAQLQSELQKLGDRESEYLGRAFESQYNAAYAALQPPIGDVAFKTASKGATRALIEAVWCADGKSWSQRIWEDKAALQELLNERMAEVVTAGRKPAILKQALQEQFAVSFGAADRLVRTECAHVSAIAAQRRYIDSGITKMQVWASEDERRCDVCGALHEKTYNATDISPLPAHPNCRCTLIPVIEGIKITDTDMV